MMKQRKTLLSKSLANLFAEGQARTIYVKTIYQLLCLMVGVSTLSGCIEEFEADISFEDSSVLVVEGTICSSKMNEFVLSLTQPVNSFDEPRMVTMAKVSVRGSDGSEYKMHETNGHYSCWIGELAPDVKYCLHIESNGEVYESEPQKPLPTEKIAEVRGVQNTPESNIDVLVTPDAPFDPNKPNYYSWTYDETWAVYPDYTTNIVYDTEKRQAVRLEHQFPELGWIDATGTGILVAASSNYEGHHIQQLKMYDIDRSNERMYHRYSGLVHQRAISRAEYEYSLARIQASSDMGGLFSPLPSALPTNIRCLTSNKHVIGFVGCSLNTSEYRFFLNAIDFSIKYPIKEDGRKWFENPSDMLCCNLVNEGLFLCVWQDERMMGLKLKTAWASKDLLDVRLKGAYIEEPDFWSLEENQSY